MNLWDLGVNDTALISHISFVGSDSSSKLIKNLENLGLKKEALIKCLHKTLFGGPRVYEINGTVCTLCKTGAEKVLIHR